IDTEPLPTGEPAAKFDLSFTLTETFHPDSDSDCDSDADGTADSTEVRADVSAGTGTGGGARPAGLTGGIDYALDLFDRATVETLAERFVRVLDTVTANPHQQVNGVDVLSPEERHQVVTGWNDTAR
ncbi:condensation domain-containing protein, partial [Streptomyces sp. FR-108]|uniref:condensation domain-containing protein n=1 Tax=Streptomyces sp. FR-108 TaxID=3416665 RepID=UPI003CE6BCF5